MIIIIFAVITIIIIIVIIIIIIIVIIIIIIIVISIIISIMIFVIADCKAWGYASSGDQSSRVERSGRGRLYNNHGLCKSRQGL